MKFFDLVSSVSLDIIKLLGRSATTRFRPFLPRMINLTLLLCKSVYCLMNVIIGRNGNVVPDLCYVLPNFCIIL